MKKSFLIAAAAGAAMGSSAMAQFTEIEANESKATATVVGPITAASTVSGNSTGSSTTTPGAASADYFRLDFGATTPGIWRWTSNLTSNTAGHTATIRGLGQTAAAAAPWLPGMVVGTPNTTDSAPQTHRVPTGTTTRENAWYSFGRAHSMYYRVAGTASTTADYNVSFTATPVTPINAGTFQAGAITISTMGQGHTSDTDFWVYDANFNAIVGAGNDDNSTNGGGTGAGLEGILTRNYAPGTYYLAMTNFNLASNQPSPSDDDFRTGTLLDFPDMALNSSTTGNVNVTFGITDSTGFALQTAATKVGAFDVVWAEFTVVPAPGAAALLGLGGLLAARRRR